jgi:hypothetical protein
VVSGFRPDPTTLTGGATLAKSVVIDEIYLTVRIPGDLPDSQAEDIRVTLTGDDFMDRLRRAIRVVVRVFPELTAVRVSLTR